VPRKILTRDQAATAKERAVSFLRNVLHDDARAEQVEGEDLDTWAQETGRTITNPKRKKANTMASGTTKADLQDLMDQVGNMVTDALDPALTREDVVQKLQEIDALVNPDDYDSVEDLGDDDDDDSDADDDYADQDFED
jgi:hypothetical protein